MARIATRFVDATRRVSKELLLCLRFVANGLRKESKRRKINRGLMVNTHVYDTVIR